MRIYDVTVRLKEGMATYAGTEPGPVLDFHSRIERGDSANVSALSLGSHTGTHVDAPDHFLDNGLTVESIPAEHLIGPALVVEYAGESDITANDLDLLSIPPATTRLLVKTRNGSFWDDDAFHPEFIGFDDTAGPWLADRGMVLVGIDYMSIEKFRSPTHAVHHALLAKRAVLLEGLDLREVPPGEYFLVCAPLPVVGADGAPARCFLLDGVTA
jgi:arylformamidase